VRTRVGYAGGQKTNPTYYNLGDHSETIQIDYDPAQITYAELLEIFWGSHNPTAPSIGRQYASSILYHNEEQKRLAEESKAREEARRGRKLYTDIVPFAAFYRAEGYHQKYVLQSAPDFMSEFNAIFSREEDFVNSTAAARVNGYLGSQGDLNQLQTELDGLGLSPGASEKLLAIVRQRSR